MCVSCFGWCLVSLTYPERAIDIVQRAIEEDTKQNYPEAYKQYQNALDYFMLALKCALAGLFLVIII